MRSLSPSHSRIKSRAKALVTHFSPSQVWIDASVADHPQTLRILNGLSYTEIDVVQDIKLIKQPKDLTAGKEQFLLTKHTGTGLKQIPGAQKKHLDGGYRELDLIIGTPTDCSYCPLQTLTADRPITRIHVDLETILGNVGMLLTKHPERFFRIGVGDTTDGLILDPIIDLASLLVRFFAAKQNAVLEIKTRSDCIDRLLSVSQKQRAVLSWILNTDEFIASEERRTVPLKARLEAARKAVEAGFRVGFHIDPIITIKNTEEELAPYFGIVDAIFEQIDTTRIAWVQLGALRYPKELPVHALKRFPGTRIFTSEVIPDGSMMRPPRFIREATYRPLWDRLLTRFEPHQLFLAMETPEVWQKFDPSVTENEAIEKRLRNIISKGIGFQLEHQPNY